MLGALADEDRDLLAGVEHVGGAAHGIRARDDLHVAGRLRGGEDRAVHARRLLVRGLLHVVGDDHAGHRARGLGHAHGAVDEVRRLLGHHAGLDELGGDVLEQRVEVDLLLVVAAQRHALLLADDRDHRLLVELGVVQPVEQVDRAGR